MKVIIIDDDRSVSSQEYHSQRPYNPCEQCPNNPINNPYASGFCNCTLPYMYGGVIY